MGVFILRMGVFILFYIIYSVIFTSATTVGSVDYISTDDGWAINSADNSVTGYDDIDSLNLNCEVDQ